MKSESDLPVTVVISRRVKPGYEADFEIFLQNISTACSRFTGHLGTNIFRPSSTDNLEYQIIFKFDSHSNLRLWENSEERRFWFSKAEELTQGRPTIQVLTGLETWFTLPGQAVTQPPPRYKMAIVSWLAVYPLLTLVLAILGSFLNSLPLILRTLIVTGITIPTMTYIVMPYMTRLFAGWLYPEQLNSTVQSTQLDTSSGLLPESNLRTAEVSIESQIIDMAIERSQF